MNKVEAANFLVNCIIIVFPFSRYQINSKSILNKLLYLSLREENITRHVGSLFIVASGSIKTETYRKKGPQSWNGRGPKGQTPSKKKDNFISLQFTVRKVFPAGVISFDRAVCVLSNPSHPIHHLHKSMPEMKYKVSSAVCS